MSGLGFTTETGTRSDLGYTRGAGSNPRRGFHYNRWKRRRRRSRIIATRTHAIHVPQLLQRRKLDAPELKEDKPTWPKPKVLGTNLHFPYEIFVYPTRQQVKIEPWISSQTECAICLECFDQKEEIVNLSCYHLFHETCILRCFRIEEDRREHRILVSRTAEFSCPKCRKKSVSFR